MNIKRIMTVITTYKFMRFIIILAIFLTIVTNFACIGDKEEPIEPEEPIFLSLPPLTDQRGVFPHR